MSINGRKISYRRIGTGKRKILFFHGFPGSSVQIEPFLDHLLEFDLEVVCVDRPGYHGSVSNNESQFKQTTEVCEHIINSLGWISVELIAVSGGTPFLFSFLEKFPERISRVSVVCGLGPISSPGYQNFMTWKAKLALKILPRIPDQIFAKIFSKNNGKKNNFQFEIIAFFLQPSQADVKTIQNPRNQNILRQAVLEAISQNGIGPKLDAQSFLNPWKINVTGFKGPISFWHGDDDKIIPMSMVKKMHQQIKRSELNILKGEGHYSLAFNYLEPILARGFSK